MSLALVESRPPTRHELAQEAAAQAIADYADALADPALEDLDLWPMASLDDGKPQAFVNLRLRIGGVGRRHPFTTGDLRLIVIILRTDPPAGVCPLALVESLTSAAMAAETLAAELYCRVAS